MINFNDILCIECKEVIYNPLCPSCLARDIRAWLDKKNLKERKILEKYMEKILEGGRHLNSVKCIACNKNGAFLCPYCFTEFVYKKLKEVRENRDLLSEFMVLFNFDFEHQGYYKDAEKLGVV